MNIIAIGYVNTVGVIDLTSRLGSITLSIPYAIHVKALANTSKVMYH
jgi:hypothetical protein